MILWENEEQQAHIRELGQEQAQSSRNVMGLAQATRWFDSQIFELRREQQADMSSIPNELRSVQNHHQRGFPEGVHRGENPTHGEIDSERVNERRHPMPNATPNWWTQGNHLVGNDVERRSSVTPTTIVCATITKPPSFRHDRYEDYRRAMTWWMQLLTGIPSERLLAEVGVSENGPAKWILNDYFQETKTM